MLTPLTILSLDQGNIFKSPTRPKACDEQAMSGVGFDPSAARETAHIAVVPGTSWRRRRIGFAQFLQRVCFPLVARRTG